MRIRWIDDCKGLAIVLIVAGHVVASVMAVCQNQVTIKMLKGCFDFIYSFHIPFFFVLAGLTFSAKDDFPSFLKKKFLRLMVPYFVWGGLSAVLYVLMGRSVASNVSAVSNTTLFASRTIQGQWWVPFLALIHAGGWPNGIGLRFNGVLWFLPMLFSVELVYYWSARFFKSAAGAALTYGVCAVLIVNMTRPIIDSWLPYNLTNIPIHLLYLAFGHLLAQTLLRKDGGGKHDKVLYVFSCFMIVYALLAYWFDISLTRAFAKHFVRYIIVPLPTILFLIWIAQKNILHLFSLFASASIGIMLFHKFPLVLIQIFLGRLRLAWLGNRVAGAFLCMLLTVGLTFLCWGLAKIVEHYAPWSLGLKKSRT